MSNELALCSRCGREYEPIYETEVQARFGETREIEVETTEGLCDNCRDASGWEEDF